MQGRFPTSQKHAIITPRLKKAGLDPADIANFRLISNLTFMSKVVDRAAAGQLNAYFAANGLLHRHQSAYRKRHSTETAMLRVWSDVLMSADAREVTLLILKNIFCHFIELYVFVLISYL